MIRVLLSERIRKTAGKLPSNLRAEAARVIQEVGAAFGDPHRHHGLGLRKLGRRSYEARIHLHWRVVFIHSENSLIAFDIMTHREVGLWLRGQRR